MATRSRRDAPDTWHHVLNRAIARRPLFEDRVDVRFFLSRFAREVRKGRLEIHAWCVLTTHFHMLVRSPRGELSEAMRQAQQEYSRFFNRRHRRDGTLIRGRFMSKPVESLTYQHTLIRYIDFNAVEAELASHPWRYPWCSAAQYVNGTSPRWLERSWVEGEVTSLAGHESFRAADYISIFGSPPGAGIEALVEARLRPHSTGTDDLDNLIQAAPEQVRGWMKRKAKLADGSPLGLPVADGPSIRKALARAEQDLGTWEISPNNRRRDAWQLAEVGLLRSLACLAWEQVATVTKCTLATSQRRFRVHAKALESDPLYSERMASFAAEALRICHSPPERTSKNR